MFLLSMTSLCHVIHVITNSCSLQVQFNTEVYPEKIEVYETYHSGAVKRLELMQPNKKWFTIWHTETVQSIKQLRVFSPNFEVSLKRKMIHEYFNTLFLFETCAFHMIRFLRDLDMIGEDCLLFLSTSNFYTSAE